MVEVPPANDESEVVTLRGPQANLVHALTFVYEKANSQVAVEEKVPNWLHRHIIGRGGENLKKISAEYPKVHVQFSDSDVVEIEGPPEQVQAVRQSIAALSKELVGYSFHALTRVLKSFAWEG